VQEPQSSTAYGVGILAAVRECAELRVDFGSESGDLTMAGLQHALEKTRHSAVHEPNFKSLPSPTNEQPALESHHNPQVMELADKTLVDRTAAGKLAQPLKPNTVRIDDNCTSPFRQITGVTRDQKPTLVWSATGTVVAPGLAVRRVHVENADAMG
jgi:hypothetical protein